MLNRPFRRIWIVLFVCAPALNAWADAGPQLTFERHIRPIFKAHCLDCHGAEEKLQNGLDLRLRRFTVKGGESGPAIVPHKPDESLLLRRIRTGEMPPGDKKLSSAEIASIEQWIAAGAPTSREEPETLDQGLSITAEEREFWAFQPLTRPRQPVAVLEPERLRTPIDSFISAKHADKSLKFSDDADRRSLIQRAYYCLTGLPPDNQRIDEFASDSAPDAYDRSIDRLLASPHYGERWGRHWLDVAGYADSNGGHTADSPRPYAYKYRDYVIRSFNRDKPLDQFIIEQFAGDELVPLPHTNLSTEAQEQLIATGFLRMAADGTGEGAADLNEAKNQVVVDTIRIVSSTLLGLSVQCAQCHDHRYDPIPQRDYYRLRAVFAPALDWQNWRTPGQRLISLYTDADRERATAIEADVAKVAAERQLKQDEFLTAAFEKELTKFPEPQRETLRVAYRTPSGQRSPDQTKLLAENPSVNISPGVLYQYNQQAADELKKFDTQIAEKRSTKPVEDFIAVLNEPPSHLPPTHIFYRGDYRQPKDMVTPGDLTIASPAGKTFDFPSAVVGTATSGRRLSYARHLTRGDHPLVNRVLVNRLWMHVFGRGIVGTPSDFGTLGDRPTHPELLDWLACELPARQWSVKSLHRLLLTSTAFQQSSRRDERLAQSDNDNRFYSRMSLRRLDAEQLLDRMLVCSDSLDRKMFGPAVPVKEDEVGQVVAAVSSNRRSTYFQARRSQPVSMLTIFDAPVMETNCERRTSSTVATQSLLMLNNEFVLQKAAEVANRARREAAPVLDASRAAAFAALYQPHHSAWQYGFGEYDAVSGRVKTFERLSHWSGSNWQAGASLPHEKVGWVLLRSQGGHTGENPRFQTIRRWTAPRHGILEVAGKLSHASESGDGVHCRVVSSTSGSAGEWVAQNNSVDTPISQVPLSPGDTLDFVTNCRENVTSDSFQWTIKLTLRDTAGQIIEAYDSEADFSGPLPAATADQVVRAWQLVLGRNPTEAELNVALAFCARQSRDLGRSGAGPAAAGVAAAGDVELQLLTNICQMLMCSNEFMYVD